MKRIPAALVLLILSFAAFGDELADRIAAIPNPRQIDSTWVADPAGVVARRKSDINALIGGLERGTSAEIAVVVLPTIGQLSPKEFAVELFAKWSIGKRDQDNGVLVLHVLDQRRIEIETGYGMEGILPDAKCHWITEEIGVPFFKAGSFADGHYEIVRALIRGIEKPEIKHADLIANWTTKPGNIVEPEPDIPAHDEIAQKYAPLPQKILFSGITPWVLLALAVGVYLFVSARYRARARGQEPYARYSLYKSAGTRMQYLAGLPAGASALATEYAHTGTFFSTAPVLVGAALLTLWRRSRVLRGLRSEPRICECGKPMRRLAEHEDDAYLTKGSIAEENIHSVDYDVWVCECGKSKIELYSGSSPANPCPKCNFKTYRQTANRTITGATTTSTGLRSITDSCANCGLTKTRTEVIPRVSTSSSGSGSGSSGSSGGSFGGGSSGGGGSGSSY